LNFGHSFGHAIETLYGYNKKINHGEAISVGMIIEAKLSNYLGFLNKNDYEKIKKHFLKSKLKIKFNNINLEKVIKIMKYDKKNLNKKLTIVLLKGIGNSFVKNNLEFKKILSIIKKF
jgi:3-dehydroquinate synthetase